jgi:hypothetical protein
LKAQILDALRVFSLPVGIGKFLRIGVTLRNPIQQLLRLVLPHYDDGQACLPDPFADAVAGFFDFPLRERGLRETTLVQYRHYLGQLQEYLHRVGMPLSSDLPLTTVSAFITECGTCIDKRSVQSLRSILKVFFR